MKKQQYKKKKIKWFGFEIGKTQGLRLFLLGVFGLGAVLMWSIFIGFSLSLVLEAYSNMTEMGIEPTGIGWSVMLFTIIYFILILIGLFFFSMIKIGLKTR